MALKKAKPDPDRYDRELAERGLRRIQVIESFALQDTGKRNDDGEPIYRAASVYREREVPLNPPKRHKDELDKAISSKRKASTHS